MIIAALAPPGTPGVLLDMFFKYPLNNLLHAQVYALIKNALTNRVYWTQYARHVSAYIQPI